MGKEVEHKYLVNNIKLPKLSNGTYFVQAYLSLKPHIRIRIIDDNVTVTIKNLHKEKTNRDEWEFTKKMSSDEIEGLVKLAITTPVEKIRYKIDYENLIWEIDVYQGKNEGLVTVDVELKDISQQISFPNWVYSDKEITNDSKYFNVNLGDKPYQEWK